jgi:hypothetical protein
VATPSTAEPPRLLSRVGKDIHSTDFAENLLFQTLVNKAKIIEVFRIVRFKSYPIFRDWIGFIAGLQINVVGKVEDHWTDRKGSR